MRIIAGAFRGRRLSSPHGHDVRPTSDRAREALFSILEHGQPPVRGARFLDLFCGTGAVGLEAHSRGASEVMLIDNDRAALKLAEANVARLGTPAGVRLLARDATRLGPAPHPFDVAFLDPPYRSGLAAAALDALVAYGWLGESARIIVELAAKDDLELSPGNALERERRYGRTKFLFLRPGGQAPAATRGRKLRRSDLARSLSAKV
jgi:16S rRNA (guanine966-N2)-methyltransferase